MKTRMWRWFSTIGMAAVVVAAIAQPPAVFAQLEDVDPALSAAVDALVRTDPSVANDPELAQLCRQVAEATVVDPRERAAVTSEVVAMHREGVDVNTVVPQEVREAAREEFTRVQGQMREQLETLRAADPERAREMELMMREGEQCMRAFEQGERYVPSTEMVAHAEGMMREWESDAVAHGAPPEFIERARTEFARWSSGEMMGGGPMGGPMGGPGHEMGGPGGGAPSLEQMEQMVASGQMTPEQLQMAKDYMANPEAFTSGHPGYETFGPMGGGAPAEGPGPSGGYMPEGWARDQTGEFHYVALDGSTPEQYREVAQQMEQQYREQFEQYHPENLNYDTTQQQNFDTTQPPPAEYKIREDAHVADHNGDGIPETHMHEIFRHTQGTGDLTDDTCHDHATGATVGC